MVPTTAVMVQIELFGLAQLACGRRQVLLELPCDATIISIVTALATACPALVGLAIRDDLSSFYESYVMNLNGLQFLTAGRVQLHAGDTLLLFSSQAGG